MKMMANKVIKVSAKPKVEVEKPEVESSKQKDEKQKQVGGPANKSIFAKNGKKLPVAAQVALISFAALFLILVFIPLFGSDDSTSSTNDTSVTEITAETTESTNYGKEFIIYEDANITAKVQSVEKYPIFEDGVLVTFSVDNKSNMNLDILTQDIYVNDVKLEGVGFGANSGTIEPGKTGLMNLHILSFLGALQKHGDMETEARLS